MRTIESCYLEKDFDPKISLPRRFPSHGFKDICLLAWGGCEGAKDEIIFDNYCLDNCKNCEEYQGE